VKFALNDEQIALQDAIKDFVAKRVTTDSVRAAMVTPSGSDNALFAELCSEMGLASLIVDEALGGYGASDVEAAVVVEQLGYALAPTPLRTHMSAQMAIEECAAESFRDEHLARSISGEELATVVFVDDVHRDFSDSLPKDTGSGGVVLTASFSQVPHGMSVRHLYFFIGQEPQLVHIDLQQDGVVITSVASIDQTIPLARVELTGAYARVISDSESQKNYSRAESRAIIALCNEMVGSTQAVLDMAVQYAKDRVQFGRPIGSFQAIKHKCADMLLETQSARSIALYGAWLASQGRDFSSDELEDDLAHVASMAKYYCNKAFSHGSGENIQIHGGIGFTMEHDAQLYFKRAAFVNAYLGLPHEHSGRIANDLRVRVVK
jgi:alkylation response protein AidB-like acyl-CoA dehydrogenase